MWPADEIELQEVSQRPMLRRGGQHDQHEHDANLAASLKDGPPRNRMTAFLCALARFDAEVVPECIAAGDAAASLNFSVVYGQCVQKEVMTAWW